jgi:MFS family permease
VLMYLATFSVMLFVPYFFARFTLLPLPLAGAVLAAGFVAMAGSAPMAGWLVARFSPGRIGPLGPLLTGAGLALVGSWGPDTEALVMVACLALHGLGLGLFQVAYMELVMAELPRSDRGVAGSLSMLTRTVGVVTGAAVLTLFFQAIEGASIDLGGNAPAAFLNAFRAVFFAAGATTALTGLALAWSGGYRR